MKDRAIFDLGIQPPEPVKPVFTVIAGGSDVKYG